MERYHGGTIAGFLVGLVIIMMVNESVGNNMIILLVSTVAGIIISLPFSSTENGNSFINGMFIGSIFNVLGNILGALLG